MQLSPKNTILTKTCIETFGKGKAILTTFTTSASEAIWTKACTSIRWCAIVTEPVACSGFTVRSMTSIIPIAVISTSWLYFVIMRAMSKFYTSITTWLTTSCPPTPAVPTSWSAWTEIYEWTFWKQISQNNLHYPHYITPITLPHYINPITLPPLCYPLMLPPLHYPITLPPLH